MIVQMCVPVYCSVPCTKHVNPTLRRVPVGVCIWLRSYAARPWSAITSRISDVLKDCNHSEPSTNLLIQTSFHPYQKEFTTASMIASAIWLLASLCSSVFAQSDPTTCVIGESSFVLGENLGDAFLTRCGSTDEWPCFCNPNLPNNAECPYCPFAAGDGSLYCARDGQNITFRDGSISRLCTCEILDDPTADPIRECEVILSEAGCNWFDLNGNEVFVENGESFGDTVDGVCGPATEWPSFCYVRPGSSGGDDFLIDYPYCVFDDANSGQEVCARDEETIEYVNSDGTTLKCSCSYTSEGGPDPTCERVPVAPSPPVETPGPSTLAPSPSPVEPPRPSGAAPLLRAGKISIGICLTMTAIVEL